MKESIAKAIYQAWSMTPWEEAGSGDYVQSLVEAEAVLEVLKENFPALGGKP